ncbi:hypothetical protein tb265_48830 [Gemmatimonadetes bacterium T265]|nr:hypothetical protein tb265_48830 [Gemmatimonadetes bacterium T265]
MLSSPYDPEARYSRKGEATWVGYKVQLTETCDADAPRVITDVQTTPATTPDDRMVPVVHAALTARGLLPTEHLVDKGYTDAATLLASERDRGVHLVGPVAADPSWQARAGAGFAQADFAIDWERQIATCPAGKTSAQFRLSPHAPGVPAWEVRFARGDCTPCPARVQCTRAARDPRALTLLPRAQYEALRAVQRAQTTAAFRAAYAARAGIESTHAQAIRRAGLRRCRYLGLVKTRLQHVATAVTLNVVRVTEWAAGVTPAPTRQSVFVRLQPAA